MNPIRAWNAFWFRPTSAKPLAAIRILFGLLVLCNLAFISVDLDYWFTDTGLLQGSESKFVAGPLRQSPFQYWQDPTTVRAGFAVVAAIAAAYTVGWRTRTMGVLLYLGLVSIHHRNVVTSSGADVLLITFAFNLMLAPAGAAWSLDARKRDRLRGTLAEPLIIPWAQRLIQVQISLIYTVASVLKAHGVNWLNGSALHLVLNNAEVRRFDFSFLTQYPELINLMTYSALAIEFGLAIVIWFRAARPWILLAGVALHTGIFFTINIPIFGELMMVGYLAFLTPEEFNHMMACLDVRRWFRRAPAPAAAIAASPPAVLPIDARADGPSEFWGPHQVDTAWGAASEPEFADAEA
ncbi:HTTM domain-containing protein [Tundrisphaera sp. TA3]|uniref:HTTM domain-containing protein n=1 Tax=Tundrisphaera sp. TA3 TaxID=3435775 RepID=UPI003EBCE074